MLANGSALHCRVLHPDSHLALKLASMVACEVSKTDGMHGKNVKVDPCLDHCLCFSLSVSPLWGCSFGWKLTVPLLCLNALRCIFSHSDHQAGACLEQCLPYLRRILLNVGKCDYCLAFLWCFAEWVPEWFFSGCIMRPKCLSKCVSSPDDGRSLSFTSYAQSLSYQRKHVSKPILISVPEIWKGAINWFDTVIAEAGSKHDLHQQQLPDKWLSRPLETLSWSV